MSIELVQTEYIRQLARVRPAFEDELADIYQVLTAATDEDDSREDEESPLASARAAYVACLRETHLTFNQLVADIAALCACMFLQEFVP